MSYRVRSLMGHGLLERAGSVARKGRPMTLYQAPSKLEAPLDLLPYDDVRGYFERVDAVGRELFLSALAARAARARLAQWVVQLYRADDGGVHLDLAAERGQVSPSDLQAPAAPAIAFNWIPAHLSPEEAKELQHELAALVARFADTQDGAGEPTHLLGVFLTPLDHPTRRRD